MTPIRPVLTLVNVKFIADYVVQYGGHWILCWQHPPLSFLLLVAENEGRLCAESLVCHFSSASLPLGLLFGIYHFGLASLARAGKDS